MKIIILCLTILTNTAYANSIYEPQRDWLTDDHFNYVLDDEGKPMKGIR